MNLKVSLLNPQIMIRSSVVAQKVKGNTSRHLTRMREVSCKNPSVEDCKRPQTGNLLIFISETYAWLCNKGVFFINYWYDRQEGEIEWVIPRIERNPPIHNGKHILINLELFITKSSIVYNST